MIIGCRSVLLLLLLFSNSAFALFDSGLNASGPSVWKLLLSLIFVIALVPLALFVIKKLQGMQQRYGKAPIQIVSVQSLGAKEKLIVVEVEQQRLLLGVTNQAISLLKTLSDKDVEFSQYLSNDDEASDKNISREKESVIANSGQSE